MNHIRESRNTRSRVALISLFAVAMGLATQTSTGAPGDLYETNYAAQTVMRFTPDGAGTTVASGFAANGLAFDSSGNMFVTDYDAGTILKFSPSGGKTTFATGLAGPYAIAFAPSGILYETDRESGTLFKFDPAGNRTFVASEAHAGGLAVDSTGNVYVGAFGAGTVATHHIIYKFTPDGTRTIFTQQMDGTGGLAFDASGNLYASDFFTGKIYRFSPSAARTEFASSLNQPGGLVVDVDGNLFVAEYGTGHIYKFTPDGTRIDFASGLNGVSFLAFEPGAAAPAGFPLNISTRLNVLTGDNALIAGFIIGGTQSKKVAIRAIGPSLASGGVTNALPDPTLELHDDTGTTIQTNNDWQDSQKSEIEATGLAPNDPKESALVTTLAPGSYTAVMRGVGEAAGNGVVEVYDLAQDVDSKLLNISSRGFVDKDDNAMIGGFILGGGTTTIVIRGLGPSLAEAGVTDYLVNPILELHDGNGAVRDSNDNWKDSQQAQIEHAGLAPKNDAEAAILATLPGGAYTAVLRGVGNTVGVGLVEVYDLE